MSESLSEKIHPATPQRRQRAREEGRVARSHDLTTALVLVGGLCGLLWLGRDLADTLGALMRQQLSGRPGLATNADLVVAHWNETLYLVGRALLPIVGLLALAAAASHVGQVGFLFLPQKLAPDSARIDPVQGAQRLASPDNFVRLLFGLLKTGLILGVAAWSLWNSRERLLNLGALEIRPLAAVLVELTLGTCLKIALVLLAFGVFDYGYQRWKLERDLRMTTQELREELKELNGVSLAAQRRRRSQRQRNAA